MCDKCYARLLLWRTSSTSLYCTRYSLGLPRVSIGKTPNLSVLLQNCQTKVYRWILRQFTVYTKISYWRHNKTKRRAPIYRSLSRYTSFWQKNKMSLFKTAKQRYTGIFFASLRYIERESAIESRTKRRGGYRYTVYCHGIPLSGDNTMSLFKIAKSVGVDFPPFYGTLNEISYWGHYKTKMGIRIYRLLSPIPFSGKNTMSLFILSFSWRTCFVAVAKKLRSSTYIH